jgi:hypothetical protein
MLQGGLHVDRRSRQLGLPAFRCLSVHLGWYLRKRGRAEHTRCKVWRGLEDGQFFTRPEDPDPADCVVDGLVYHVIVWTDDGKRQVNYCDGMNEVLPVEAAFQMEKDWIEHNGRCQ